MQAYFSFGMIIKYVVILFAYGWGGLEVYQQIKQRKGQGSAPPSSDRGSLTLLYGAITLGYCIAIPTSFSPYGQLSWGQLWWQVTGLAVIAGGLWIRYRAMRTLASLFTYTVEIQTQHRLVQTGLYRWVRHPGYLGQLLVFLGIGLALANWIAILALMVPIVVAFSHRIGVEERALQQHFGVAYEAYCRRSRRLIPWLY